MRSKHLFALAGALSFALGCGGDSLSVDNADALGTVGGVVIDATTRAPLAGVSVDVLAGGVYFEPVVTEGDGRFSFAEVPAGEFLVSFTGPAGYQAAWARDEIPSSAGEFPTGNAAVTVGPIGLIQADQNLRVRVLDDRGRPVNGYEIWMRTFAQYLDFTTGRGVSAGETLASATTDPSGYASFVGVPNFFRIGPEADDTVEFLMPPRDEDSDGVNEYPGGQQSFRLRALTDPAIDIFLEANFDPALTIRTSNLNGLTEVDPPPDILAVNDTIFVLFNAPVDGLPDVAVTDEDDQAVTPEVVVDADSLSIDFSAQPLAPGQEYNLTIQATSTASGTRRDGEFAATFFTTRSGNPLAAQATLLGTGEIEVVFTEPVGIGGGQGATLDGANCVLFFDTDLDGSATVGDAPGELGNTCNTALSSDELDPAGPVGPSGYTRRWLFTPPTIVGGGALPTATPIIVRFSDLEGGQFEITRPDGSLANDVTINGYAAALR
ncbi:hypothetical protein [Haliangium sp.]|uniref:hypothetical protein n=1 Tax=Haliangium sp. TaxID=2663208 RepID=UPI003D138910